MTTPAGELSGTDGPAAKGNGPLEQLFGPYAGAFQTGKWPQQRLAWHAPLARMGRLGNLTIEQLFGLDAEKVKAIRHRDSMHHEQVLDSPTEHLRYWQLGYSLCYVNVESALPLVGSLLDKLAQALAYPRTGAQVNAYASPAGHGFGFHFDAQEVIIVQVLGSKDWHLAPNSLLDHPPCNAVAGWSAPPRLSACLDQPYPTEAPPATESVRLRPGSVLYLPRGFWHATSAGDTPSLSLTLTFPSPTPLELLLDVLAVRLERDWRWRQPLFGTGSLEGRMAALSKTQELFDSWIGAGPADSTETKLDRQFRIRPGVNVRLAALRGQPVLVAGKHCCPLEPAELPLARWLGRRDGWFGLIEICQAADLPLDRVEKILEALVRLELFDQA